VPTLVRGLRDGRLIRDVCLDALLRLGPVAREALPAVRRETAEWPPLPLAEALERMGRPREAARLREGCLTDTKHRARLEAARQLIRQGRRDVAVPVLRREMLDEPEPSRTALALLLWRVEGGPGVADPRALRALSDLLEGPSDEVGFAVAEVYCRLSAGDTVPVLVAALEDQAPDVRLVAALVLARVVPHHPALVPALRSLLERHPDFFGDVADTLADLGPLAAPLAPLLRPALRHEDDDTYRAVRRVLRRIEPNAPDGWSAAAVPGAVPANLAPLWDDLASIDPLRADLALWRLAGAGPRTVTLLTERLRPPPALAPERIARLIADLDSDDFEARQRASAALADAIESAAPALRKALAAHPPLEKRRRIDDLLLGLDPARSPELRRQVRAVRLLEEVGGPDARALLTRLAAGGPQFRLTQEATAAVQRLTAGPERK
jgi:hypothetical protein